MIIRVFYIKIHVIMDVCQYNNPIAWSRNQFYIEWYFPSGDMLRTCIQNMKESEGKANT